MSVKTLDISQWKYLELIDVTKMINYIINNKYTNYFFDKFDFDSLKIQFNEVNNKIYVIDKYNNMGMIMEDDLIHIVDNDFKPNEIEIIKIEYSQSSI